MTEFYIPETITTGDSCITKYRTVKRSVYEHYLHNVCTANDSPKESMREQP